MSNEVETVKIVCTQISFLEKRNRAVSKYKSQKTNKITVGTQTKKDSGNTK